MRQALHKQITEAFLRGLSVEEIENELQVTQPLIYKSLLKTLENVNLDFLKIILYNRLQYYILNNKNLNDLYKASKIYTMLEINELKTDDTDTFLKHLENLQI